MKMILSTFALLFLVGATYASQAANNYVNSILSFTLKNQIQMQRLDPQVLSNFNTQFQDKVAFVKVKGTANYTNGKLIGLANAARYSECYGPSYSFGLTKVNCTIGFYILHSQYEGKVKYGKLPAVHINANANISTTTMFVDFVSQPGSNVGQVANMQFQLIGEVQPKFTGLGSALNKQLKVLENDYKTHVRAELIGVITNRFHYALNMATGQIPMPR